MDTACVLGRVEGYRTTALRAFLEDGWRELSERGRGFRAGDRVLLKPNLLAGRPPERVVNTHPEVVGAVASFLADQGCRLFLGDSPSLESTAHALAAAGYAPVMARYAITPVSFHRGREVPARNRRFFSRLYLFEDYAGFDHVVNLPKLKTHTQMGLTLGVKNLFGFVPGRRKAAYHLSAGGDEAVFARLMLEIADTVNPTLTVLDGIQAMEGDGPGQGTPRNIGLLMMSRNCVALDAVVGRLTGVPLARHPIVREALAAGLPGADWQQTARFGPPVEELAVAGFRLPARGDAQWRLPHVAVRAFTNAWTSRPWIRPDACRYCLKCAAICPVQAIADHGERQLRVDPGHCVRCWCCHEVCPHDAIAIRDGAGLRTVARLGGWWRKLKAKDNP